MKHFKRNRRLGLLAVGLGIGAAAAATPGIAGADPQPVDVSISGADVVAGAPAIPLADPQPIDISIDGMDVFHQGTGATAISGTNDWAIAIGNGSIADAGGVLHPGQFDTAFADGTNSTASSGNGNFDSAFADGDGSMVHAEGDTFESSSGDFASAFGTNSSADAGAFGNIPSENDVAIVFDPFGHAGSVAEAVNGNFDLASVFGDNSLATAGFLGNFDIASVFGDGLNATGATGGNFLLDILPTL